MFNFPLQSKGIIQYDPRGDREDLAPWCLIVKVDEDFQYYYRWLARRNCIDLRSPAWGAHITLNRKYEPSNKEFWGWNEGKEIVFKYHPNVIDNKKHFWLEVDPESFIEIKEKLGLFKDQFHITIGSCF